MKKFLFILGIGLGFVLGSRAGTKPYEQLRAKVGRVAADPAVQETVAQVKGMARDTMEQARDVAEAKLEQAKDAVDVKADEVKARTA